MHNIFYLLLGLYILSHLTSTAGQEIFGWSIFALFLFEFGRDWHSRDHKRVVESLKTGADFPLLAFGGWALLSAYLHFNSGYALFDALSNVRWIFLLYGLTYMVKKYFNLNFQHLFFIASVVTVIVGAYGIMQMFVPIDLVRESTDHLRPYGSYYRPTGFFKIPLTYAYCLGMVGLFSISNLLLTQPNKKLVTLSVAAGLFTFLGVIASSTRGAWIGFFVATVTMYCLTIGRQSWRFLFILMLAASTLLFEPSFRSRVSSIADFRENGANFERIAVWRANFAMFMDNPLLGVGFEQNKERLPAYYNKLGIDSQFFYHAHNDLLSMLSGLGLPGTLFYLWFCIYFLRLAYLLFRDSQEPLIRMLSLGALGAQVYFHVGGLTQANFIDNELNHILMLIWALLAGMKSYSAKPQFTR